MRYAGIIKNDFSAAPGTCVTFFTQGCPHRCEGCHNPETWNFQGGREFTPDVELAKRLLAIFGKALLDLLDRLLPIQFGLAEKLVGKTDQLLLQTDRTEVLMRQGKLLFLNHLE